MNRVMNGILAMLACAGVSVLVLMAAYVKYEQTRLLSALPPKVACITGLEHYQDTRKLVMVAEYNKHAIDVMIETRMECVICHDAEVWR